MEQPGHTYRFQTLVLVYVGLVSLAAIMVALSRVPLERIPIDWMDLHVVKGICIFAVAGIMGVIVAGFLMGLKYEKTWLNAVVFCANFAFLLIFLLFVWADFNFRGLMDPNFEKQINWESPVLKQNAEHPHEAAAP